MTTLPTTVTSPSDTTAVRRRERATTWFSLGYAAFAVLVLGGLPNLVLGWSSQLDGGAHRLHEVTAGIHLVLLGAAAVVYARAPRSRPAAFQLMLATAVPAVLVSVVLGDVVNAVMGAAVLGAVPAVLHRLHPQRRTLLRGDGWSPLLTPLGLLGAAGLLRYAWVNLDRQRTFPVEEAHAALDHWGGMAIFATVLIAAALVAMRRSTGFGTTAALTGAAAALFGLASVLLPHTPSTLGTAWGAATIVGGAAFAAAGLLEERRTR